MREIELRERGTCTLCGKGIGHVGVPLFWTLRIERHGVKRGAVMRQDGLAQMLGGHSVLASVMGPDEEMTTPLMPPVDVTLCEHCSTERVCVAQLALDNDKESEK